MILTTVHPAWCAAADCPVTPAGRAGTHRSRPVILDPDELTFLAAEVRLLQPTPVPWYPLSGSVLVELTINLPTYDPSTPEEEFVVTLRGSHAQALGRMLLSAGRAAE